MPKLPSYTAQIGAAPVSGGRRAEGTDFGDGFGAVAKQVQNVAEAFLVKTEEDEARKAVVASAELRAKYARELDQAALTGADTDAIKQKMNDDFAKVGEGFQTKKGSSTIQLYASNTELMFDEQSNQIKVQRAYGQAKIDGAKFLNNSAALIQSNPAYLPQAEKDADFLASTFSGIRADQRAAIADDLKKDLNMASAMAASRIDPEGTRKKLEGGAWNLTPEQRRTAIHGAETEMRAKRADEAYQRAVRKDEENDRDDKARDAHFKNVAEGKASRRQIMDDPNLKPQTREHLILLMEHRAKELAGQERKSDQTVKRDLFLAATAPEGDPRKIYTTEAIFKAAESGKLNTTDATWLNGIVAGQRDENYRTFSGRAQGHLMTIQRAMNASPQYSNQPELAAAVQMELVSQLEKQATALRKAGKSPDSLLDPDSKDFFFKPGTLKSTAEAVKARVTALTPPAVTVNTQAEYDALEPGTPYVDAKGVRGVKTGAAKIAPKGPTATGRIQQ